MQTVSGSRPGVCWISMPIIHCFTSVYTRLHTASSVRLHTSAAAAGNWPKACCTQERSFVTCCSCILPQTLSASGCADPTACNCNSCPCCRSACIPGDGYAVTVTHNDPGKSHQQSCNRTKSVMVLHFDSEEAQKRSCSQVETFAMTLTAMAGTPPAVSPPQST